MQVSSLGNWKEKFNRQRKFLPEGLMKILPEVKVFLPGVGAFGGPAAIQLAKMGVQNFILSDGQNYELDSIVGQLLATESTIGKSKTQVAQAAILDINPKAKIEIVLNSADISYLKNILKDVDVMILGMDVFSEGIACYRAARLAQVPVIDFLFFLSPNVCSTMPGDPTPEERFDYPTLRLTPLECDAQSVGMESMLRILAYGFANLPKVFEEETLYTPFALDALLNLERPIPTLITHTVEISTMLAREAIAVIALKNKLRFPRLGWPAFYLDVYNGETVIPKTAYLSELARGEEWIEILTQRLKGGGYAQ